MPQYEYSCEVCGISTELQGIKDAPLTVCPVCKMRPCKRILSIGHFKINNFPAHVTKSMQEMAMDTTKRQDKQKVIKAKGPAEHKFG
jgi:putative FmdB family regulatory protein